MKKTMRHIAVDLLVRIDRGNAYSNEILDTAIKRNSLSRNDQRLLTKIFYGVLENRILIDFHISALSKIRIGKLHKEILNSLRIAIYQIIFLDSVPVSAAVNESVKIANITNRHLSGFVNGVLRNFARKYENGLLPLPGEENGVLYLSTVYSLPEWLVEKLLGQIDFESLRSLAASNNQTPPISLRTNTIKTTKEELKENLSAMGIDAIDGIHAADALIVKESKDISINDNPYFTKGHYYIQDEASMLVSQHLSPKPGDLVYDLCAAPGGKTTHIAQMLAQSGRIKAFDLHSKRVESIVENAKRLGIENIDAETMDTSKADFKLAESADRVLVDVPCSGIGIFRRKPELRYRISPKDINLIIETQKKIIGNAAIYVKKNGFIIYSTCTVNYNENDEVIFDFLEKNKNFRLVDINKGRYPAIFKESFPIIKESIHTYSHRDGTDGFFICMLQKK